MFRSVLLTTTATLILMTQAADARMKPVSLESDSFANSTPVGDEELSNQRGKFFTGGLTIDFALTSRVLVDGVVQSNLSISSANLENIVPADLQRIVQVGTGNVNAALDELQKNPNIVTVIQNSQDNRLIQTLNQLDLTVNNVEAFRQDQNLTNIEFGQINALK